MESYFRIDHARKTCIIAYINLLAESQKYGNCMISEKKIVMVYIDIVVFAPVLLCKEHWCVFMDFFREFHKMT